MKVRYKKNRMPLVYDPEWLPTIPHEPPEPVCGPFERCAGCPYPGHGFMCWGAEEEKCLRTEMAQIMERDRQKSVGCAG